MTATPNIYDPLRSYAGLYEISDSARIINVTAHLPEEHQHVSNRQILRWIRKGLALPRLGELHGREILLSFEDLVSMRVIALLRAVGISWKRIYDAERWLRAYSGAERPFANEALWTYGRQIFASKQGSLVAASMGGQYPFPDLVEAFLVRVAGLTFSSDGQADSWMPQEHILLKPQIQFGEPCIAGTRITTAGIWGMNEAGDSEKYIARILGVSLEQVREAVQWERRLQGAS